MEGGIMIFTNGVLSKAAAASLFASSPSFLADQDSQALRLQPMLHVESPVMGIAPGFSVVRTGSWTWDGVRIHDTAFKTASVSKDRPPEWFAGHSLNGDTNLTTLSLSAGFAFDPEQARDFFAQRLWLGSWETPLPEPVYVLHERQFESWWRLELPRSGIYWMREHDGKWGQEQIQPLHLTAKALLYRENKVVSASTGLEEIELSDLLDVSYLRSKLFRVLNCMGAARSFRKCGNFARSNSGVYRYGFDTPEHSEMVAYYSINRAMKWHQGIQSTAQKDYFGEFGLKGPIDIFVRAADTQAFYQDPPHSLDSPNPYIAVGIGEETDQGTSLRYLTKDSDVYIHEFAHHVLFRSIKQKSVSKQGRIIQEGLADYFTYAITGNNFLGESVIDLGGSLRQGNKTEVLEESRFPPSDEFVMYEQGALLSSVIWSMRENSPEWRDGYRRIDKVLWDSIDLLPAFATLYQLACAMYITAGNFETSEGLPAGDVRTPMTNIFVQRNFFASNTPASGESCPPISAVLQTADSREGEPSSLPPVETPRTPVPFTGETVPALPPVGGSVYLPLQPRRPFCGSLAARSGAANATALLLALPLLFIGSRLRRLFRWLHRCL
jgi:hypothetical protein